jgi:fatty-acyl-CoA synthase
MAVAYTAKERAGLHAKAHAMLEACPDVGSFIRRGLGRDPEAETLVYLRTALDPAPVVTKASEFQGLLNAATRWLRRQGVGPRDVVSLLAANCPASSVLYWAAMSSASIQPLNLLFTREAIAAQLNAAKAKILFTPPPGAPGGLYEKSEGLRELAPSLERVVVLPLDGRVAFGDETLAPSDDLDNADVSDPGRIVALLPTGGTTGAPKVVPLSNRNVVSSAIGSMLAIDLNAGDRILIALPMFHVGGAFCTSLPALGSGATMIVPTAGGFRNPDVVTNFWRVIESQRVTHGALVPTGLGAVAAVPSDGADLSSLRFFGTGGSVCPPEIERRFLVTWPGDCVRQVYGMTEFAGAFAQTPWDHEQRAGSGGIAVALAELAVLADGEIHRGPSPPGEILARGPQAFSGYLDPRQIGASFHEGWLRSGDLGRIGEDGEVYVTGRAKDAIIRGGHNIDPTSIEDVALRFPGVGLAAAVGRPDAYAGETPVLFVSPSPGMIIDEAALADHTRAGVAEPPARPREIVVIEEMPTTLVGKIFKPRLREIAAEVAARELLSDALSGIAVEIAASHTACGLVLQARVPAHAVAAAREELSKLPVPFEVEASSPVADA